MTARRHLPTEEARDLLALVREIADQGARSAVGRGRGDRDLPARRLPDARPGRACCRLPYPEEHGGGGQPYEVYLQVLEEIGAVWSSVGVGVSVHALSCFGLAYYGTDEQRAEWLPDMLGGDLLGAYCLSEAHAGSDPAAMRRRHAATATPTSSTARRPGPRTAATPTSTR